MSMDENPTRVPEEPPTNDAGELQPTAPSIIAADPDRHADGLDAVAGSEFVDDRIRLQE